LKKESPSFKVRARLLNQLGEQLIKNEAIALLELIKNAYDADASDCSVIMKFPDDTERGKIVIIDDGTGMDYETLSTVWLEVGTSFKADSKKKRSDKYDRISLGEKGIGRLGVHRLGREIEIISKKKDCKECRLYIDWDEIDNAKYIENLPVLVEERDTPLIFINETGTKIKITCLRVPWTRGMVRDCARAITSLNSPFEEKGSFRVLIETNNNWLDGIMEYDEIEQYKLFSFDIKIKGNEIIEFKYQFIPWSTMNKLKPRTVGIDEIATLKRMVDRDKNEINLESYEIGIVRFKGVIFDRDARTLSLGVTDKLGLKTYLDENGGIQVFRDNMRVYDYGEPGNDWLELDARRVNIPGKRFSNNIVLGAVYLNMEKSSDLKEKANREGFVDNDAFKEFKKAIEFCIERIESLRKTDKDSLREHYGPQKTKESLVTMVSEVKDIVEKNVQNKTAKKEILRYLGRISDDYEELIDVFIKNAGAGLNLITVIHQMQKIIREIIAGLRKKVSLEKIEKHIKTLSDLVEGYSILIKKSDIKERKIVNLIEQSMFNVEFRLEAHKIIMEGEFRKRSTDIVAICSESHLMNALLNIIDNSIWWLGYSKTKNPSIYIDISLDMKDFVCIVVADNGPGFTKPTEEIVKPFVSDKPGGMGIGLHLTEQIMSSLKGKILFPDKGDFDIPEKYSKGAKIVLAFIKGEK